MVRVSTRERLLVFFTANPDEELTARDVMAKYGLENVQRVRELLRAMEVAGLIRRQPRERVCDPLLWSAGPLILREARA